MQVELTKVVVLKKCLKNNPIIFIILNLLLHTLCNSNPSPLSSVDKNLKTTWEQVPLRSAAQKNAGSIGGEGMQMIWGISYAKSNPKVIYLLSDTSQVWKSTNSGASWFMINNGFLANGGVSLAVNPFDENIVFVAGSKMEWDATSDDYADGIYRTTDGGKNWKLVKQTSFFRLGNDKGGVNFAFSNSNTVFAGTHTEGLLKSTDGGDSWISLNILTNQNSSVFFIAGENGLYKYSNNSAQQIGLTLPDFPRAIAVNPINPDVIYVSLGFSGIYKSTNGGENFSSINNGLPSEAAAYLAISPVNPDRLYVSFYEFGGNHPYYTHNAGMNWYALTIMDKDNLINPINNDSGGEWWGAPIAPSPIDPDIAITSGAGNHIEITSDGGVTWTFSGDGYCGGRVGKHGFSWDLNNQNRFAFFLIDFGVVLSEDKAETFRNLQAPDYIGFTAKTGALDPTSESDTIITALGDWNSQIITVSNDNGLNWTQKTDTESDYDFIGFHPQNTNWVYAGNYRSDDKGNTWQLISKKISAIYAIDGNQIAKSMDKGTNWTYPYATLSGNCRSIAVDPVDQDRLYSIVENLGLYIWDKSNSEWRHKNENDGIEKDDFGTLESRALAIDPTHPNVIYLGKWIAFKGHANGVFRSKDYGETWTNISYNLGNQFNVWSLSLNPHDGYIYLGSSHGTWRLSPPYKK